MNFDNPNQPASSEANSSNWHRDHDDWERDVSRWQGDHQRTLAELRQIEQLVLTHGAALRRHARDLDAHKRAVTKIEDACHGALVPGPTTDRLAKDHRKWREVHDRIRRHHDNVMVMQQTLLNALAAPM